MKKMKCTQEDYTASDLPLTRKDVFSECYKEHFSLIFKIGLVCLFILLPAFLVMFTKDLYIISAISSLTEPTEEAILNIYYSANAVYGLFEVGAFVVFGVLFAGVVQILRQMLWNEPIFFGDDFKNGLKSNAVRFGTSAFILAMINYLLNMLTESLWTYILSGGFIALILPIAVWFGLQNIYYRVSVVAGIKNAILMYTKTLPATVLLFVATIIPFWLATSVINFVFIKLIVLLVMGLFYVVPLTMCWILYALHIFDKYINQEQYPEIYRKGMRKLTEENEAQETRSL